MKSLQRKSPMLLIISLLLVSFLSCITTAPLARADVAPIPILPGGSSLKPDGETPIQMTAERVVMTVRQGTEAENAAILLNPGDAEGYGLFPILLQEPFYPIIYKAVFEVVADFTLKNPTGESASMTVWFPLASVLDDARWEEHIGETAPRIENFQVSVDGEPLEYTVTELPNPQGEDKPPLPWASFPVTFPAGEEVHIQVGYVFFPLTGINLLDMTISYIFQTGAGWAGPIEKAELQVNLPYPASPETIGLMPDGGQVDGQQVRWTWENLEPGPGDDSSILLSRPERWEELKYSREIVSKYPDFAQGWLGLASLYERFSQGINEHGHILQYFGETYQQLGVQAAQEAARLDPAAIGPHYELALLYASALTQNPSPEELQPVLDEIEMIYQLNPEEAQALQPNILDLLDWVLYNDATATAIAVFSTEVEATEIARATLDTDATATAAAATSKIEATLTPDPSQTPKPIPSATAPAAAKSNGQATILAYVAIVVALVILGYLVWKRTQRSSS